MRREAEARIDTHAWALAGSNYSEGDEIFIEYSRSCNDRLQLVYGFDLGPLVSKPCSVLDPRP